MVLVERRDKLNDAALSIVRAAILKLRDEDRSLT